MDNDSCNKKIRDENLIIKFMDGITNKGQNKNNYKFFLAKLILSKAKKNEIIISLEEIAESFIDQIWDQKFKYKIRQSVNPLEPSILEQIINIGIETDELRNQLDSISLKDFKKIYKGTYKKIVEETINSKNFLANPLSRFQVDYSPKNNANGDKKGSGWIYEWNLNKENECIRIKDKSFLLKNMDILESLTLLSQAYFLENFNSIPKLIRKIDLSTIERTAIPTKVKNNINSISNSYCFYCDVEEKENNKLIFEHFLPHVYVFEHKEWNIVKSCINCNIGEKTGKFTQIPKDDFLQKLLNRNTENFKEINQREKEFQDADELSKKIISDYNNALERGYKTWSGPVIQNKKINRLKFNVLLKGNQND